MEQTILSLTSKPQVAENTMTRRTPVVKAELKCYNCFEPSHISWDCPKLKTKWTKQVLAAKLAALTAHMEPKSEAENEEP